MDEAGAMLWGRATYELMESAWPAIARDGSAPRAMLEWARKLEVKPKYVVSSTRRDFPWSNTFLLEGDLREAVARLKEETPRGVLVGSPMLSAELERLGLIDEHASSSTRCSPGTGRPRSTASRPRAASSSSRRRFEAGQVALHYRRRDG